MSDDLINRRDVLKLLCGGCCGGSEIGECGFLCDEFKTVLQIPAVGAEPVRRGEWAHLGGDEWCCTSCGNVIYTEGSWEKPTKKYCHECGAKMDGDKDAVD